MAKYFLCDCFLFMYVNMTNSDLPFYQLNNLWYSNSSNYFFNTYKY